MLFPDEAKVWEGLLWCLQHAPMGLQSAESVHSQTTENKDSVGLASSATTVFLYKSVPIGQNPLLIRYSHCIPANLTKAHICMHTISQATSLLVFIIISYCMKFFSSNSITSPRQDSWFSQRQVPCGLFWPLQISIPRHQPGLTKKKAEDLVGLGPSGLLGAAHWFLMQFHHGPLTHNPQRNIKVSRFARHPSQPAFTIQQWTSRTELIPGGSFCGQWRDMVLQKSFEMTYVRKLSYDKIHHPTEITFLLHQKEPRVTMSDLCGLVLEAD